MRPPRFRTKDVTTCTGSTTAWSVTTACHRAEVMRVSVSLDPSLASQVDGDDKVFIIARYLDGEQPQLAVVQGLAS